MIPLSDDTRERLADSARQRLQLSLEVKTRVMEEGIDTIVSIAERLAESLATGGKVLMCGNGGSAADAQHLAAELLIRLRPHLDRQALPALALAGDTSSITACGNDLGFDAYYERMTLAHGSAGDVLIGISTSGDSENIVRALRAARREGIATIGLLGSGGGRALAECDVALVVPATEVGAIQEAHIAAGHVMLELVEDLLMGADMMPFSGTQE